MKHKLIFVPLMALVFTLTGCPRYETVRRVSQQQLNTQKAFKDNLATYFKHMSDFAKAQVSVAKFFLDDLRDQKLQNLEDLANDQFATIQNPTQGQRDANRKKLGEDTAAWKNAYENKKKELDDLVTQLDAKHAEMLNAYSEIVATQEVLNDYIKMKKYDEVIVDGLMDKLKLNQDKVNALFQDASSLADKISKPPVVTPPK